MIPYISHNYKLLEYLKKLIFRFIRFYQNNKPQRMRGVCIYEPSCSEYSLKSIEKHGIWKGMVKSFRRIKSCKAGNEGGIDLP